MMFQSAAFDSFFAEAVTTLKPYLGDLVCIGGCANALYRYHERASSIPFPYLGTKDLDWASPQELLQGERKRVAVLMAEAEFKEEKLGASEKAVVKYLPQDGSLAADIEFLCPQSGLPGGRNKGSTSPSYSVQPGLMAQPLRYLELLQHRTWEIELVRIPEFVALGGLRVKVPNPAAYVVQKVLIRDQRRSAQSAAKDCYYLYEVSVIFRDALDAITEESAALRETFKPWLKKFPKMVEPLFANENAEGPAAALRVFNEARVTSGFKSEDLTAEMIYRSAARLLAAMK
jgi:hypothetical protein